MKYFIISTLIISFALFVGYATIKTMPSKQPLSATTTEPVSDNIDISENVVRPDEDATQNGIADRVKQETEAAVITPEIKTTVATSTEVQAPVIPVVKDTPKNIDSRESNEKEEDDD